MSSREVAERFEKQHKDVLETVRNLIAENSAVKNMLFSSTYKTDRGREYPEYLMNRDGFSLLVMGFTGSKALEWKLKYIKAFNKMEETIRHSLTNKDAAILAIVNAEGDIERAVAVRRFEEVITEPLKKVIEENEPLVNFATTVTKADNSIDMGSMAKMLHEKNNIDIGRNRLFQMLKDKKILMSDNTPYQTYIERGWFKVIEVTFEQGDKIMVKPKTLVTGKGQLKVVEMIINANQTDLVAN